MLISILIKRVLITFWILFCIQIFIFLILEDIFPYTIFKETTFFYSFYFKNLFYSGIAIIIIIYFFKKIVKEKISIIIEEIDFNLISKIFIYLTLLGVLASSISKYLLYGDQIVHHYIENPGNINCIISSFRGLWKVNRELLADSPNILLIYNILSPIGTILINFFSVLMVIIFFFSSRVKNRINFFLILSISVTILFYCLMVGSKNILFNSFSLSLCCLIISYIVGMLDYKRILIFFFFSFLCFCLVFLFQQTRTNCSKINQPNYDTTIEFENKITEKSKENEDIQIENIEITGRYLLNLKDYKPQILKLINVKDYFSNVTINHTLWYLLTGKVNGEYILKNVDRPVIGNIIIAKTLNIFTRDLGKQIIAVKVDWIKSWGGVSFLHLLWYDFSYFGIVLFVLIISAIILLVSKINIPRPNLDKIKFILILYLLIIFFYIFVQFFNWYALETINSRFIFFDLLIFKIYLITKINIKNKLKKKND